jgi:hypothetical protein
VSEDRQYLRNPKHKEPIHKEEDANESLPSDVERKEEDGGKE